MRTYHPGTAPSLSDTSRPREPSQRCNSDRATRGNAWSYYVFRPGIGRLQRIGRRISIGGLSEALMLES